MNKITDLKAWCEKNYEKGASTMVECWDESDYDKLLADNNGSLKKSLKVLKQLASIYREQEADARISEF